MKSQWLAIILLCYLQLTEIFQTEDKKMAGLVKNILVFGNLLRLPPVFEGPVYTPLTSSIVNKHTDSVGAGGNCSVMMNSLST